MSGTRISRTFSNNIFNALFAAQNPSTANRFVTINDLLGVGIGTNIFFAANYSALPDPLTHMGYFYWVDQPQGTKWTPDWAWLPGDLGAPYYGKGLYYSNGVSWETADVPFQASQVTVNAGLNDNQFVTPLTLSNSTQMASKVTWMTGVKSSAIDAGNVGEMSIENDYIYVCVQTGVAGSAIWKKAVLFAT